MHSRCFALVSITRFFRVIVSPSTLAIYFGETERPFRKVVFFSILPLKICRDFFFERSISIMCKRNFLRNRWLSSSCNKFLSFSNVFALRESFSNVFKMFRRLVYEIGNDAWPSRSVVCSKYVYRYFHSFRRLVSNIFQSFPGSR